MDEAVTDLPEDVVTDIETDCGVPPRDVFSVTALNSRINEMFEAEPGLADVYVVGEVANLSRSSDGHVFLDLKDSEAKVACVLFSQVHDELGYDLADGDEVLVKGTAEYYEPTGGTSLKITEVHPVGEGKYYAAMRKRLKQLEQDGLFAPEHKQDIPQLPERIGVVTSTHSAAVQDIVDTIHGRYPSVDIVVKHAAVQGEHAVDDLIAGIEYFDGTDESGPDVDAIIIGRGGGSIEDLEAFNAENLVRAIYDCATPVVSGVGHRSDETITGHVADVSAITPTAAAERAVPDRQHLDDELDALEDRLRHRFDRFKQHKMQEAAVEQAAQREQRYRLVIGALVALMIILLTALGVTLL